MLEENKPFDRSSMDLESRPPFLADLESLHVPLIHANSQDDRDSSKHEKDTVDHMIQEHSNNRRRERDKNNLLLIYEIDSKDGSTVYKEITLRSLLVEVNAEIENEMSKSVKRYLSLFKLAVFLG